jgi:sugar O-acyltransferase (sialic acid O-acetyltransferase NeuD family)
MIFFGAGGHAKVVIEAWVASGGSITTIIDDDCSIKNILGFPVTCSYSFADCAGKTVCVSIGSNEGRRKIAGLLRAQFQSVIHPLAVISSSARIGGGSVAMAGVVVNAAASIGDHVILNTSSVVDHDCIIDNFVHVSPNATLCGGVSVGEGSHIGAGATVIQNVKIGKWASVGAGSVILEDVPDFSVVVGVPGKVVKYNRK